MSSGRHAVPVDEKGSLFRVRRGASVFSMQRPVYRTEGGFQPLLECRSLVGGRKRESGAPGLATELTRIRKREGTDGAAGEGGRYEYRVT